jgi:hypothetical protein
VRDRGRQAEAVFVLLLVVGLVVRILAARTTWLQPDSDETTGMFMAQAAAHGHLSLLFWGANYGGAVMTWLEAPLVLIFGAGFWMFWTVDTIVTIVAAVLLYAIGRRILPPVAGAVAAGVFWLFPATWVFWSAREEVFWLPSITFALVSCLFALRWFDGKRPGDVIGAGLTAGLALWSYPMVAPLLIPAWFAVALRSWRDIGVLARLVPATVVGAAPWGAYFLIHGSKAFHVQRIYGSRLTFLRHAITQTLPATLVGGQVRVGVIWGLTGISAQSGRNLGIGIGIFALAAGALALARRQVAVACCAASVVLWPPILVAGHVPVGVGTFRYGLVVMPALLVLGCYVLSLARASLVLPLVATWSTVSVIDTDTKGFTATPPCSEQIQQVDRWLVQNGRLGAWGSYWLSGPVEICGEPHVKVASVDPIRDSAAESAARAAPDSTYVVIAGQQLDQGIRSWIAMNQVPAKRQVVAGVVIWTFDSRVTPGQMGLLNYSS